MRVIFFGTSAFAVPSLERLAASAHAVVMCVTRPDRPQGRGLQREPSPVKRAAQQLALPLSQPERLRAELFAALRPEVGVVVAYGQLIRRELFDLPAHGMLGVHPSLLPRYRGAAPIAWTLLNGERTTGVTIFRLNERLDAGEIVAQESVAVEPGERSDALSRRLADRGAAALLRGLEAIDAGRATFTPQEESNASMAPKLTKAQGRIDWREPAEAIERLVRATMPWPGAATSWEGTPLKIVSAVTGAALSARQATPGTVIEVSSDRFSVAAGAGTVVVTEVQPSGRKPMTAKAFLAGHSVSIGDRLGG